MGTKTISLSDEAYTRLKSEKKEGESFSEVVTRLTERKSLLEFAGAWKEAGEKKIEKVREIIKREREISQIERKKRLQRAVE